MCEEYEELSIIPDIDEVYNIKDEESPISIFDIINDISNHGSYIKTYFDDNGKLPKEYNVYMINKAFSNFDDTIFIANEMNKYYNIPNEMHWRFMSNVVSKRKRYSKWFKSIEDEEPIELLAKYFNCSVREMQKNISFMPKEKQNEILKKIKPEKYDKVRRK